MPKQRPDQQRSDDESRYDKTAHGARQRPDERWHITIFGLFKYSHPAPIIVVTGLDTRNILNDQSLGDLCISLTQVESRSIRQ
jgi:hypothetical protein